MKNSLLSKFAGSAALIVLGAVLSGCADAPRWMSASYYSEQGDGSYMTGFEALSRGDYKTARDIFAAEYQRNPDDLYAVFNLADSYNALGQYDKAVPLYRQLAAKGKDLHPDYSYEMPDSHPSFSDLACWHLKRLSIQDTNCPV